MTLSDAVSLIRPLPTVRRDLPIWRCPVIAEFTKRDEALKYLDERRGEGLNVEITGGVFLKFAVRRVSGP